MHCFILFFENEMVYHMEHPNFYNKGIFELVSLIEYIQFISPDFVKFFFSGVGVGFTSELELLSLNIK